MFVMPFCVKVCRDVQGMSEQLLVLLFIASFFFYYGLLSISLLTPDEDGQLKALVFYCSPCFVI